MNYFRQAAICGALGNLAKAPWWLMLLAALVGDPQMIINWGLEHGTLPAEVWGRA